MFIFSAMEFSFRFAKCKIRPLHALVIAVPATGLVDYFQNLRVVQVILNFKEKEIWCGVCSGWRGKKRRNGTDYC